MEEKRRPYNTRNDAKRGNTKKTNNTTKSYLRRILIVPNRICTNMFHGCALLLVHNCCCCCCYCFRPAQAVDETANFFKCSMNTCRLTSSVNTGAPPSWTNAILQLVDNSSQIRPNFNEIND